MKLFLALLVFSSNVFAQGTWPTKPVRILLGFAPGGNTDIVTRVLAQRMEALGQPMVVENKTGLGGVIATIELARAAPDGYTLLMQSTGPHTISPFLLGKEKVPYDPVADFAPVSNVAFNALALMVHPSIGAKSVSEFIASPRLNQCVGPSIGRFRYQ